MSVWELLAPASEADSVPRPIPRVQLDGLNQKVAGLLVRWVDMRDVACGNVAGKCA